MDLGQFASRMQRRADAVPSAVARVVREVATELATEIISNTPVDTGAARSNWLASASSEVFEVIDPHSPYVKETNPAKFLETANRDAAIAAAEEVIATVTEPETIYIQNNLGYITDLESGGHSRQAQRFVRAAKIIVRETPRSLRLAEIR